MNFYSRSPLSETGIIFGVYFSPFLIQMSGRLHRVDLSKNTLVLPLWNWLLRVFENGHFTMGPLMTWHMIWGQGWWYHPTPILYIYSLGHFLTTKGALIDGDGYPPKNPKKGSKKVLKSDKNWSKLRSKNGQNWWFLMAKSSFSSKSLKSHSN